MNTDRVFVYGTLMRGEAHHGRLEGAEFLGEHMTRPAYTMLHTGRYPGVVKGGYTAIRGEVYRLSPGTVARLDRFEDVPAEFFRARLATPWGRAWIYLYNRPGIRRKVKGGNWRER